MTPRELCSLFAAMPTSGILTKLALARRAGQLELAPACGWLSMTIWPIRRTRIRLRISPRDCGVLP